MTGRLGYNSQNGRYGLLVSDLWEHEGFHCGERLEVMVDGKWTATRMEMSARREWYLVGTDYNRKSGIYQGEDMRLAKGPVQPA